MPKPLLLLAAPVRAARFTRHSTDQAILAEFSPDLDDPYSR